MAMKYIKLFESWRLMEGEDDIDTFAPNAPKKFPVLQTTVGDFFECSDKLKIKLIASVLQRACQKEDGAFNVKAGENVKVDFLDFGVSRWNEFQDMQNIKADNELFKEFGIPMKGDNILWNFLRKQGISANSDNGKLWCFHFLKISDGSGIFYYIPFDSKYLNSGGTGDTILDLKFTKCDILYKKEGGTVEKIENTAKPFTLGMLATFAQAGMTEDNFNLLDKSNATSYKKLTQGIFAGEELTSAGKFAKTVKIGNQDLKLANGENGTIIPLYVATNIMGTCGFDFNKATLKEDAKDTLSKKELWDVLTKAKNTIEIIGHTDSIGTKEVNMALSKQRAESVLKFLQSMKDEYKPITQKKIKVTTTGMGFEEMVQDDKGGKDKDAAAKNRRVVIKVDGVGPDYKALLK